jgi:hypothetical protein
MMKDCEVRTGATWHDIDIDEALSAKDQDMRCIECHGRVVAHKAYNNGVAAHFEHSHAHTGCSQIPSTFSGVKKAHPGALK